MTADPIQAAKERLLSFAAGHPSVKGAVDAYEAALAEARRQIAEQGSKLAEVVTALSLVRMSRGWQYMADETREIIDRALLASPPSGLEIKPVTMLVDQDWLSCHVATDPDASVEAGPDVLAWLSENRNVELSFDYGDADDDGKGWCVHRVNGGVNDREWTLIGTGATPLDALRAALQRKGEAG